MAVQKAQVEILLRILKVKNGEVSLSIGSEPPINLRQDDNVNLQVGFEIKGV